MVGGPSGVVVRGLREFRRELSALENPKAWLDELKGANREVAELVAETARGLAVVGPTGRWQKSIAARATAGKASIGFGGARAPHAAPLEFDNWRAKPGWRAQPAVYPAIEKTREATIELYGDKVEELTARAFPS